MGNPPNWPGTGRGENGGLKGPEPRNLGPQKTPPLGDGGRGLNTGDSGLRKRGPGTFVLWTLCIWIVTLCHRQLASVAVDSIAAGCHIRILPLLSSISMGAGPNKLGPMGGRRATSLPAVGDKQRGDLLSPRARKGLVCGAPHQPFLGGGGFYKRAFFAPGENIYPHQTFFAGGRY